jgi:hypothetical protein
MERDVGRCRDDASGLGRPAAQALDEIEALRWKR